MEQNNYNIPPPTPQMYYPPDYVSPEEKKKIRRSYNIIGIFLIAAELLMIITVRPLISVFAGELQRDENGFPMYGAAENIIVGIGSAAVYILLFAVYCLISKYRPKDFFGTKNVSAKQTAKYAMIVLFMQQVSAICSMITMSALDSSGFYVPSVNYGFEHTPQAYATEILAAVVLAPIGEELLYRGIVLGCASKVSQRFAIFFSAFLFGLAHGNPYQFVLGFLCGIPMAMITVKTGSLIPSIICHIVSNTAASIPTLLEYFSEEYAWTANIIKIPVLLIIGLAFFISEAASGGMKLPPYTNFHKKRTLPILVTSWSCIVVIVFYVFNILISIAPLPEEAEKAPEMIEQAARIVFRI